MKTRYLLPLAAVFAVGYTGMVVAAEIDDSGAYLDAAQANPVDIYDNASQGNLYEPQYGVQSPIVKKVLAASCNPIRSEYAWGTQGNGWTYGLGGDRSWWDCTAALPDGALMTGTVLEAIDNDPADHVYTAFLKSYNLSTAALDFSNSNTTVGTSTTPQHLRVDLTGASITVDNNYYTYFTRVGVSGSSLTQVKSVGLIYQLQISPAPGSASFNDVPTYYWAFREIEALSASGITSGCGGGSYCPNANVTRAQMAVFLAKGLGLHWNP